MNYKQLAMCNIWDAVLFNLKAGSKNNHDVIRQLAAQNPELELLNNIVKALGNVTELRKLVVQIPK